MKSKALVSSLAAVALIVGACSGGDSSNSSSQPASSDAVVDTEPPAVEGGVLRVGRPWPIDGFKGDNCLSAGSITMNLLVYDTLLRIPENGAGTSPGLAESVTYDEATTSYVITLREGLTFSDGSPLTSEDVVFTIDQWRNGPNNGVLYGSITGTEIVDELTVRVLLAAPDALLPYLLMWCNSTVYPSDFGGLSEEEYFKKPISAGPFTVAEWTNPGATESIVLEANPNHWDGPGGGSSLDRIEFQASLDPNQQLLAFEAGELDLIEVVDPFAARDLDESVRRSAGILPITLLTLNQSREDLSDPTVRAAISQAINRDDIASLFEGTAEPATGVLPVNVDGWAQGSTSYEFDADSAKSILEPLGLELELLYDSSSGAVSAAAEVLAAQLGEVGVTVSLNGSDNGTVVGRAFASDFDMVILQLAAISPTILDPIGALAALYYPWAKADTTLIFEQFLGGSGSFDVSAWEAASAVIQDDARSQNALIGLYNFSPIDVVSSRVVGFERTPFAVWYSNGLGVSE